MTATIEEEYGWNLRSSVYHRVPERVRLRADGASETLCGKAWVTEVVSVRDLAARMRLAERLGRSLCRHCQVAAGEAPGPPQRRSDPSPPSYTLAAADVAELDPAALCEWLDTLAADPMAFPPDTVAVLATAAVDLIRHQGVVVSTVPDPAASKRARQMTAIRARFAAAPTESEVDALATLIRNRCDAAPGGRAAFLADPGGWLDAHGAERWLLNVWTPQLARAAIERVEAEWRSGETDGPDAPLTETDVAEVDALVGAIHDSYGAIPGGRAGFLADPGGWLDYLGVTTELRLPDEWEDRIALAAIERIQAEPTP